MVALLKHLTSRREVELSTETIIGRSPRCRVVVDHPLVSSLHAQLRWLGTQWCLSDLSRNGTWVNGRAHRRDEDIPLLAGDSLCFGRNEDPWVLEQAGAPRALLIPVQAGPPIPLGSAPIALPTDADPKASVFLGPDGVAVIETAAGRSLLSDGAEFELAGCQYQVHLACPQPPTASAGACLEDARLTLAPAQHEEHVGVTLTVKGRHRALRPRVHFGVLLELARERLADRARGVSMDSEGWVYLDDLCARLLIDRPTFNTYAHRLRKQFHETELTDAVNILERRVDSDEVRIGCGNIAIDC